MATAAPDRCPSCHAERLPNDPSGYCPRCLLRVGLGSDALGLSRFGEFGATVDLTGAPSVLETLAAGVGPVPRVLLPDTDPDAVPPVHRPGSPEMPAPEDRGARIRLLGEIARGGMGAVLKGRDDDLGRELAVKVLLEKHRDDPDLVRRFVEEAQIGGQLQHPGIVPIYELGAFADRRPYFAMKLVKGQTLAALLEGRSSPGENLPRFVGIFEQICQTVAYAHARGVIHRDLKPSNVMVGGFGEVQVMDWGLAKVLPRGGAADDAAAGRWPAEETVVATARTGKPDADLSRAGSVMGTPSYMAPEQARGEGESVDERADVFALGSILCEVLTGSPAFVGRDSGEIQRRAARADLAAALARLDDAGAADAELVGLARDCLAIRPKDRPRDAGVVSERVGAHLAGVQERLRAAEIDRARAEARAAEERRRRRLQVGLAASLLALTTLGGLAFTYELHRRQAAAARSDRLVGEAVLVRDQARERPDDVARWERARDIIARIADDLDDADPAALAALRRQVRDGLEAAVADRDLMARLIDIRGALADDPDGAATAAAYAAAFGDAGIDPDGDDPAAAGAQVARRPPAVSEALVAALDHWAAVRRALFPKDAGWWRPLAAARAADPDPDRDALRDALLVKDQADRLRRLRPLADRADAGSWAPASLILLGGSLAGAGDVDAGVAVLRRASGAHPADARIHNSLGELLTKAQPPQREEAIRAYSIARALQPELAGHELAHMLERSDRSGEAEGVWLDLIRRRPDVQRHLSCFVRHIMERGLGPAAPGARDRAIAAMRDAVRRKTDDPWLLIALYRTLSAEGKLDDEAAAWREAVRRRPDDAWAHANLGEIFKVKREYDGAIAEFREAIRLQPDLYLAHVEIGGSFWDLNRMADAVVAWREALRIRPDDASINGLLYRALSRLGQPEEAIAFYRERIRLHPGSSDLHCHLGEILAGQGKRDEAAAAYREAIRLNPDYAEAHCSLGNLLVDAGDFAGGLAELRSGHELGSKRPGWRCPSAAWVLRATRLAAAAERLQDVLRGAAQPADDAERLLLAEVAYKTRKYAAATRFFAEALESDPKLAADRRAQHRYNAACVAALAAAGRGEDDPPPDDAARAELRGQALGWLKAELAAWSEFLAADGSKAAAVAPMLQHWKQDPDLAGVRDPDALENLPEAERTDWGALWGELDRLLKRASKAP